MPTLAEVRVGDAIRYESLSVFPLFSPCEQNVPYVLSDEAIASGSVVVEEVSEGGSVPTLLVRNTSDSRVLFLEGEELRGAKQNRVLNTSALVAAHSKTPIPVSCVEQGRWGYRSRRFSSEGSHSSSKLRHFLKASVSDSIKRGRGHSSDQGAVWQEVSRQAMSLKSSSPTGAMSDTYTAYESRLAEFRDRLGYVEGATGVAVAIGPLIVSFDVFDKPETCRKVWSRRMSGVVMDAIESPQAVEVAGPDAVLGLLTRVRSATWEPAPAVGEGQELRCDADSATHASALLFEGTMLHGSVVVAS